MSSSETIRELVEKLAQMAEEYGNVTASLKTIGDDKSFMKTNLENIKKMLKPRIEEIKNEIIKKSAK